MTGSAMSVYATLQLHGSHQQPIELSRIDHASLDLPNIPRPDESHVRLQFLAQYLNHSTDTVRSVAGGHRVENRPTNADRSGSQGQSFDDVGTSPYTTVDEDLHSFAQDMWGVLVDLQEREEGRLCTGTVSARISRGCVRKPYVS